MAYGLKASSYHPLKQYQLILLDHITYDALLKQTMKYHILQKCGY